MAGNKPTESLEPEEIFEQSPSNKEAELSDEIEPVRDAYELDARVAVGDHAQRIAPA